MKSVVALSAGVDLALGVVKHVGVDDYGGDGKRLQISFDLSTRYMDLSGNWTLQGRALLGLT
jgi:hypothetical protein